MPAFIRIPNGQISLDPFSSYPQATEEAILESTGFVGPWILTAMETEEPFSSYLPKVYPWGLFPIPQAEIKKPRTFTYPGDPDLQPIFWAKADAGGEFLMYPHALVAFRDSDQEPWTITRMD